MHMVTFVVTYLSIPLSKLLLVFSAEEKGLSWVSSAIALRRRIRNRTAIRCTGVGTVFHIGLHVGEVLGDVLAAVPGPAPCLVMRRMHPFTYLHMSQLSAFPQ